MSTLVGQNPQACREEALDVGVCGPQRDPRRRRGDCFRGDIVVKKIEGGCEKDDVAGDVVEASAGGTFKTVSRNGIADLLDGVVGKLELVAVSVEKFRFFGRGYFLGADGGKRSA